MSTAEMAARGWDGLDVLLVGGDAYVDHPGFGVALVGRVLAAAGWRVGVCAQPQAAEDLATLGRPRLWLGVSGGNLDAMLARYTAARKPRSEDAYSPGGQSGLRPDRPEIAYAGWARQVLPGVPVVLGGIGASLRRFVHWDHWQEKFRRSLLADAKGDLLIYGMAEAQVLALTARLAAGETITACRDLAGTCHLLTGDTPAPADAIEPPGWEEIAADRQAFAAAAAAIHREQDPRRGRTLVQDQGWCRLVQRPPAPPPTTAELDRIYELPFSRRWHPSYDDAGGVPALATVRTSLTAVRGCCGECSFCAIGAHQGRIVTSRSPESLLREAERLADDPGFGGTVDDVGGPTANLFGVSCPRWEREGACADRHCLWPEPCPQLCGDLGPLLAVLAAIAGLPGIAHVFVRSGLRHDLLLRADDAALEDLFPHLSGTLKIAPEAADDSTLAAMRKPAWRVFAAFLHRYARLRGPDGRQPRLVPYLIAAHPGGSLAEAATAAAERLRPAGLEPDQVQEFVPAPLTLATAMQVTGRDPLTGRRLAVTTGARARRLHKALLHSTRPANRRLVREALERTGLQRLLPVLLERGRGYGL